MADATTGTSTATQTATVPWLQSTTTTKKINGLDTVDASTYGTLNQSDFLKLLTKELSYQDPLSPMDNKDFIAQMANFTSLEQMKSLVSTFTTLSDTLTNSLIPGTNLQHASSLIGFNVRYQVTSADGKSTEVKSGTVSSVTIKDKVPYLMINGSKVSMDSIVEVD